MGTITKIKKYSLIAALVVFVILGVVNNYHVGQTALTISTTGISGDGAAVNIGGGTGVSIGGTVVTATAGVTTYTATQMCGSVIFHNPNGSNVNGTTATATQLITACVPTAGDSHSVLLRNTADAADVITIVAGTNIIPIIITNSDSLVGQNQWNRITFTNLDDINIAMELRTSSTIVGTLNATLNTSFVAPISTNPSGIPGQTNIRVGSFTLTTSSSATEAVNINQIGITANVDAVAKLQNLKVMVGSQQIGITQATVVNQLYTFNPSSNLQITAGGSAVVDVYADIMSNAATGLLITPVSLTSITATGAVDNAALGIIPTLTGQSGWIAVTLAIARDSSSPSGAVSANTTQNIAVMNVTNNAAVQQATLFPTYAQAGSDASTLVTFNLSSTIAPTSGSARIFKLFKSTDLVNPVLAGTITPVTSGATIWTGTLSFGYNGSGVAIATFIPSSSTNWTSSAVTAVTIAPQVINASATVQYQAQFDTSGAGPTTLSLSLQSQGTNEIYHDGASTLSTLNGIPVTFGTLAY